MPAGKLMAQIRAKLCSAGPKRERLGSREHQLRPQATDRRGAECEAAAIQACELDHDRKPQPRTGLGLIETAAAARHLLALLGRKTGTVVVDHDPYGAAVIPRLGPFRVQLAPHPRPRPSGRRAAEVALQR